jgi:hypothetical protein
VLDDRQPPDSNASFFEDDDATFFERGDGFGQVGEKQGRLVGRSPAG